MPKIRWDGDAASAARAAEDLAEAMGEIGEQAKTSAKEAKALDAAARRIAEAANPQEKYNRQIRDLAAHVKAGRIEIGNAERAAAMYREQLARASGEAKRAFSPADFAKAALAMKGVTEAIKLAVDGFREFIAERERIAQLDMGARGGIGSLSQLAAGEDDPEAAYERLTAEARKIRSRGATQTLDEAGNLLFDLVGAGLNKQERDLAVELRRSGTLINVGGAAQAFDALKTSLGGEETGNFSDFMSKALRAAGPAPGSFEQLPIAAARGGGSARTLGLSDEFLLAATTIVGKARGSIDEGGTQVAAFLKQVEQSGLKVEGKSGIEIVEAIKALPESQQGYGGVLGDRSEAIEGFRTLSKELVALKDLEAKVVKAQDEDLATRASRLPMRDPRQRAALLRAGEEAALEEETAEDRAEYQNLVEAARANIYKRRRREDPGLGTEASIFLERQFGNVADFLLPGNVLSETQSNSEYRIDDPTLNREIRDYLKRTAENTGAAAKAQRGRAAARPE